MSGTSLLTTQQATAAADAENIAKITRQITRQLARRFAAAPHPLTSTQIGKGLLRSLNAPIGGSAVAAPLSLDGSDPVGDINSLNNLILEGADFGVAISIGYINGLLNDIAASIKAYTEPVPAVGTIYDVKVTAATATWVPQTTDAKISLKVEGSAISRPYHLRRAVQRPAAGRERERRTGHTVVLRRPAASADADALRRSRAGSRRVRGG